MSWNPEGGGPEIEHSEISKNQSSTHSLPKDIKVRGSIKLVISELSNLKDDDDEYSPVHIIGGLPWQLRVETECSEHTENVKHFSVYVECNSDSESTLWSCEAFVEIRLHNQREGRKPLTCQFNQTFHYNCDNGGECSFIKWTEILDPKKGFIKNDSVTVEADIGVQEVIGVRLSPSFDFTTPHPNCSDGILVIDNVRLHISKPYLALFSPVFSTLFYGEFKERNSEEIPLKDIVLEEFVEMLHVVYPSHKPVSDENVEFLLKLGDKYQVQYVIEVCEKFLVGTEDIPVIKKLIWADQYKLTALEDACVRTFKNFEDIEKLTQLDEYEDLRDGTKAALLEKIFSLS